MSPASTPAGPAPATPGPARPTPPVVPVSDEQIARLPNGLELCYQTFGDPAGEPLLLVMGLGGPMIWWSPEFCGLLAQAGFFVIRFDNRDTGRSSRDRGAVSRRMLVRSFLAPTAARTPPPPYTLDDLAHDAFALLDHLDLAAAHVLGVSMGGMVAQTMALTGPERVRSLTSVMSTTGRRTVGWQDPRLLPLLLARSVSTREAYVASSARLWTVIGSPGYPEDLEESAARAGETWDRGISAAGVARQMLAVLHQPDRSRRLRELTMPALVIHGLEDKMVHVSGGRATSRAIPGSELVLVPGMGHDLPEPLFGSFVEAIARVAARAGGPITR